jgi:hypothetical protein
MQIFHAGCNKNRFSSVHALFALGRPGLFLSALRLPSAPGVKWPLTIIELLVKRTERDASPLRTHFQRHAYNGDEVGLMGADCEQINALRSAPALSSSFARSLSFNDKETLILVFIYCARIPIAGGFPFALLLPFAACARFDCNLFVWLKPMGLFHFDCISLFNAVGPG